MLPFRIPRLVEFCAFVDVGFAAFEEPVEQTGDLTGHRGNGLGAPNGYAEAVLRSQVTSTADRGGVAWRNAILAGLTTFDSLSRQSDTEQIFSGKLSRLLCTAAGSTLRTPDGHGLRGKLPARLARPPHIPFLSIDSHVGSMLLSDLTSRRWPLHPHQALTFIRLAAGLAPPSY